MNAPTSAITPAARLHDWSWQSRRMLLGPLVWLSAWSGQRSVIDEDVAAWRRLRYLDEHPAPMETPDDMLRYCLTTYREFRNVFYYRLERGNLVGFVVAKIARRLWRPVESLHLSCADIGPGLVVRHGYSTILSAERIGSGCFVHHDVTIGWDDRAPATPTLGDNVYIGAGARILGAISVGNDVRIGANAVVVDDVPDGCTAVGVPARVLPRQIPNGEGPAREIADWAIRDSNS